MRIVALLQILLILDLALLISFSVLCMSDDAVAPKDCPTQDEISGYEVIEETDTYKIYRMYGYTFMDTYEDDKVRTRLIAQTEMHITFIPCI